MARCRLVLSRDRATVRTPVEPSGVDHSVRSAYRPQARANRRSRRNLVRVGLWFAIFALISAAALAWLAVKASLVKDELESATALVAPLRESISANELDNAEATLLQMRAHTTSARVAAEDPVWSLASAIPGVGANFSAISEVARTADDVAELGLTPLISVAASLDWNTLVPGASGADLTVVDAASPSIVSAAHAVRTSADRLEKLDVSSLLPQVADPLTKARGQLAEVTGTLDAAADASQLLPPMLGHGSTRTYLLMIQNNAESRASGGIPGALAVLTLDEGKLSLGQQTSASQLGVMDVAVPVDAEQTQIFSTQLGRFMQDANLTPDFPTAARTAQSMWEQKTGQHVDGVLSIDPVTLGYLLQATGPVSVAAPENVGLAGSGLPVELNGTNVVQTLLSDVYAKIPQPQMQDAYFAEVAQQIFSALDGGRADAKSLISGISRGATEGRVLVWSGLTDEQTIIGKYPLSGSISGPSVQPAQFGAYFNDGTGAKMDYYVRRTVQLIKECPKDGYEEVTVRVTSTNTAPADAATSLPAYVTGDANFGVPRGSVQTNILAYGPVQANVETVKLDGRRTDFAPYVHRNRPVGVYTVQLAPGESQTIDFTFGKIVQHTEPNVVVTPTVQQLTDVVLPAIASDCE